MSVVAWLGVAGLGGLGALARFLLDRAVSARANHGFPFGTLAVNATGSLALGLVSALALSGDAAVLAGSATVGSYTTFSTWMFETHRLGEDGQLAQGALNLAVSLVLGFGAVALGRVIGGAL